MCYYDLCDIIKKGLVYNSVTRVYFYTPESKSFDHGLRLIWDDSTTIEMLDIWYKYGEIDLYVEHEIDEAKPVDGIIGPPVEDSHAFSTNQGKDEVVRSISEGVTTFNIPKKVVGNEKLNEDLGLVGAEVEGSQVECKGPECGLRAYFERPDGCKAEVDNIRVSGDGLEGLRAEGHKRDGVRAEDDGLDGLRNKLIDDGVEGNGLEFDNNVGEKDEAGKGQDSFDDDNVYLVRVRCLFSGKNDDELQAARQKLREYKQ
ncbi:hypothetical protein PTKIN_Ptkin13bG0176200 [Pterospermum kingtungense]